MLGALKACRLVESRRPPVALRSALLRRVARVCCTLDYTLHTLCCTFVSLHTLCCTLYRCTHCVARCSVAHTVLHVLALHALYSCATQRSLLHVCSVARTALLRNATQRNALSRTLWLTLERPSAACAAWGIGASSGHTNVTSDPNPNPILSDGNGPGGISMGWCAGTF